MSCGLLVQAGLPAMTALETATAEPARFLGVADRSGSVARGKVADLVILGASPLEDITNTQKIDGVVVRGCYIDSAGRTEILRQVEEAAAGMPMTAKAAAACPCATRLGNQQESASATCRGRARAAARPRPAPA